MLTIPFSGLFDYDAMASRLIRNWQLEVKNYMNFKFVKIVVFVPVTHADKLRKALAEAGAGQIGNYDSCSFSSKGIGRFRPLKGSKPFLGGTDKIEEVDEERIEVICRQDDQAKIIDAIKKAHPYEEPAIDIYPLLN